MLSMADGLDCNCSGASAPYGHFPSGNVYGNSRSGGSLPYGGSPLPGTFGNGGGYGTRFPYSNYMGGPMFGNLRN